MTVSRNTLNNGKRKFCWDGKIFNSPDHMVDMLDEYLTYLENNPLKEQKYFGKGDLQNLDKMNTPCWEDFARYLMCTVDDIKKYKDKGLDWAKALRFVEDSIHSVAYKGAAAGLIKEAIVTRKLGLAEKVAFTGVERKIVILHAPSESRSQLVSKEQRLIEAEDVTFDEDV